MEVEGDKGRGRDNSVGDEVLAARVHTVEDESVAVLDLELQIRPPALQI